MLKKSLILDHLRVLPIEYLQSKEEGKDVSGFQEKIDSLLNASISVEEKEKLAGQLLDKMNNLQMSKSYKYVEPSTLDEIKALRPAIDLKAIPLDYSTDILYDKIYGAWLGRCAGCLLGQPIEGWKRNDIKHFLEDTDNYTPHKYISSDINDDIKLKYGLKDEYLLYGNDPICINWINNINCMPEDDDINYTIISLKIIESYGSDFVSDDVAECWLLNIPLLHLYTAERITYRNLSLYKFPPYSATYRNPYREWVGAQIRGDFWGYINLGNIELAAEMAFRDACVSHVKNGIYGEMFVAGMIASTAVCDDIESIIRYGLSQIPKTSRLAEQINWVLESKRSGLSENQVIAHIHSLFDENLIYHWCHVIPNAMIVCFALLYGNKDFDKSLALAIISAFDTDCNAATVGSIIGLIIGAEQIPTKWVSPLHDTLESGVKGFEKVSISSLAKRTVDIILK